MRYMPVAFCFSVMALAVSCGESPPKLLSAPGVVNIVFKCEPGGVSGASVRVVPWRVEIANGRFEWKLVGSNVSTVRIEPTDPLKWPFVDPRPIMVPPGIGQNVTAGAKGTYKYRVIGICPSGEVADTVILDPDMIIPN